METVPVTNGLFELDGTGEGRLLGARCRECARYHFPSSRDCPYCGADECESRPLASRGVLCLFTTVVNRPPGYSGDVPFGFGVVELPEGLRMIARITESDPAHLDFGMPVRLTFVPLHVDEQGRQVMTFAFAPERA